MAVPDYRLLQRGAAKDESGLVSAAHARYMIDESRRAV